MRAPSGVLAAPCNSGLLGVLQLTGAAPVWLQVPSHLSAQARNRSVAQLEAKKLRLQFSQQKKSNISAPPSPSGATDSRLDAVLVENAALRKKIGDISDSASSLQLKLKSKSAAKEHAPTIIRRTPVGTARALAS